MSKKLTEKEIIETAHEVAHATFNFMRKKLEKEVTRVTKGEKTNINEVVNIFLIALSSLDTNMLVTCRNWFKNTSGHEMDFVVAVHTYLNYIFESLNEEERRKIKEKLH